MGTDGPETKPDTNDAESDKAETKPVTDGPETRPDTNDAESDKAETKPDIPDVNAKHDEPETDPDTIETGTDDGDGAQPYHNDDGSGYTGYTHTVGVHAANLDSDYYESDGVTPKGWDMIDYGYGLYADAKPWHTMLKDGYHQVGTTLKDPTNDTRHQYFKQNYSWSNTDTWGNNSTICEVQSRLQDSPQLPMKQNGKLHSGKRHDIVRCASSFKVSSDIVLNCRELEWQKHVGNDQVKFGWECELDTDQKEFQMPFGKHGTRVYPGSKAIRDLNIVDNEAADQSISNFGQCTKSSTS